MYIVFYIWTNKHAVFFFQAPYINVGEKNTLKIAFFNRDTCLKASRFYYICMYTSLNLSQNSNNVHFYSSYKQ